MKYSGSLIDKKLSNNLQKSLKLFPRDNKHFLCDNCGTAATDATVLNYSKIILRIFLFQKKQGFYNHNKHIVTHI